MFLQIEVQHAFLEHKKIPTWPRLYSGATQTSKKVKKENKNFSVGSQMQSSKIFGQLASLALPRQLFVCIELRLHVRL